MDSYQKQLSQIMNKMIFDAINETFDHFRLGRTKGCRLPPMLLWNELPYENQESVEKVLDLVVHKVVEWGGYVCGFIENKEDSLMQLPYLLDEEILTQIKEDRMFKLLLNDVREYEAQLQTHDDEFYEVGLEISNLLFEYLIDDVVDFNEARVELILF